MPRLFWLACCNGEIKAKWPQSHSSLHFRLSWQDKNDNKRHDHNMKFSKQNPKARETQLLQNFIIKWLTQLSKSPGQLVHNIRSEFLVNLKTKKFEGFSQTRVVDLVFCVVSHPEPKKIKSNKTHQRNLTYEFFLTLKCELNEKRKEAAVLLPATFLQLTLLLWHCYLHYPIPGPQLYIPLSQALALLYSSSEVMQPD